MDNHWIALYLSGKYPGHNRVPDKLLFVDRLQLIDPTAFSDEKLKLLGMFGQVDEYEFYLTYLNKVGRDFSEKYTKFLADLGIPMGIFPKEEAFFDRSGLFAEWKGVLALSGDHVRKGPAFEAFLGRFFGSIDPGLSLIEIKAAEDEQIDLILKNNINRPFWNSLSSPIIMGEAKNWSKPTPTEVINTLDGKINNHTNLCRVGIVISMEGFTSQVSAQQMRKNNGRIIAVITGEDIAVLLENAYINPLEWLEGKIINAFK